MKIAASARLTHGLAAICITAVAPTSPASASPTAVNVAMMPTPNSRACRTASRRVGALCSVKYATVIGTIGNTQGVSSDSAPADAASQARPAVTARPSPPRRGRTKPSRRRSDRDGDGDPLGARRHTERRVAGLEARLDGDRVDARPGIAAHSHRKNELHGAIVHLDRDAEVRVERLGGAGCLNRVRQLEG